MRSRLISEENLQKVIQRWTQLHRPTEFQALATVEQSLQLYLSNARTTEEAIRKATGSVVAAEPVLVK